MSGTPLRRLGALRALEGVREGGIPLLAAGGAWYLAYTLLSAPVPGRPTSTWEQLALIGACAALTGWAIARVLWLLGYRRPWPLTAGGIVVVLLGILVLSTACDWRFEYRCKKELSGAVQTTKSLSLIDDNFEWTSGEMVCAAASPKAPPYLPGVFFRSAWQSQVGAAVWTWAAIVAGLAAVGARDRPLWATRKASRMVEELRLAPAAGSRSLIQPAREDQPVDACGNATLWSQLCAQLYERSVADRMRREGALCARCHQTFRPANTRIRLRVVSLVMAEVDQLNALERADRRVWKVGDEQPSHGAVASSRWAEIDSLELPDVLTVAQVLALIHERLERAPRVAAATDLREPASDMAYAAQLARRRASRVSAWLWFGDDIARYLHMARPPAKEVLLAVGTMRLRDLVAGRSHSLWLQLDVGLLPLELRRAHRVMAPNVSGQEEAVDQNSISVLWVRVGAPAGDLEQAGVWVPRVEGAALRSWLAIDRLSAGGLAMLPYQTRGGMADSEGGQHAMASASDTQPLLDYVRMPYKSSSDPLRQEPSGEVRLGAVIADWDWLEWEQIQLLRQQCLVLVGGERKS